MCEPVSMTLLAAGAAGGTSLIGATAGGAALTTGAIVSAAGSAAMAGASTYFGMQGADQHSRAGWLQGTGSFLQAGEMQKQIQQIEDQAAVEEVLRRQEYTYLTAKNAAAATAAGVQWDSATFDAIRARNEKVYRRDESIASVNEANAKGQAAGQGIQHSMAGFASIAHGERQAQQARFDLGIGLAENWGTAAFGLIGGGGITNPSKSLMAQVQQAVK